MRILPSDSAKVAKIQNKSPSGNNSNTKAQNFPRRDAYVGRKQGKEFLGLNNGVQNPSKNTICLKKNKKECNALNLATSAIRNCLIQLSQFLSRGRA